MILELKKSVA